ncbi:MAG: M13 family metallopeptidase [Flavobacteriaceae bacterium]|nr:M13 family metallopeptidase [Flavobacteriaceae bacterium]
MKKVILGISALTLFAGCKTLVKAPNEINIEGTGINMNYIDRNVRPQDDFYQFVNGNWMKSAEIPADRSRWGSFDELRELTDSVSLKVLHRTNAMNHAPGSEGEKISFLYSSIMDESGRNAAGIQPLQPEFQKINQIKTVGDLQSYLDQSSKEGFNPFYNIFVRAHMKDSRNNAVYFGGPSLGMGRDYYQKSDEDSQNKLRMYQNFLEKLLAFAGENTSSATGIVQFEKQMASEMLTVENIRNSQLRFNPRSVADLEKIAPGVHLAQHLARLGVKTDSVILSEISYIENLGQFLTNSNIPVIRDYMKVHLLMNNSSNLSTGLEQLHFDFFERDLRGVKQMRSADKRALSRINSTLGEALGKYYVEDQFPPQAKEKAAEMVDYVVEAMGAHIRNLNWMTAGTKEKALEKLNKFNVKIAYPDKWKDYSALKIVSADGGKLFENMQSYRSWRVHEMLNKVGKPVDKTEWGMPPQTVNAYFNSSFNEIVFPAAILQPPFYDFKADAAVNFGGIGAVIGHEISHGFDDSGSQYDGDGNLRNWWMPEDRQAFEALGEKLASQYDAYEPLPGIFVNGKYTLGENIGDLGGVEVAFSGLKSYLKDYPQEGLIDGFTPEQRFFMSWATIWRTKARDEFLKNQVKTDPHSPGYYRANGPLINVNAFHEAFQIKKGDLMYKPKDKRIKIW